jgi:nucleoside-diphosphate-sugar epimerase
MKFTCITGGLGYVGSALAERLHCPASRPLIIVDDSGCSPLRYQHMKTIYNVSFIHLAAHSSVAACQADPWGAVRNNLSDVIEFVRGMEDDAPFIYASTGSVHDQHHRSLYDETRRALDAIITLLHPNAWGLRFATVCGVSPVMRDDTILNGMTKSAVREGVIRVRNQHKWRPVLSLDDLCWFVDRCLSGDVPPGIHDVATFNCRIGGYADLVRQQTGAEIIEERDTPTYDFSQPTLGRTNDIRPVIEELVAYWKQS